MEGKEEDVKVGATMFSERIPIGTTAQTHKDYKELPAVPLFELRVLTTWSFYRAGIAEFTATFMFLYISMLTVMGVVNSPTKCGTVGIQGIAWAFGVMIFALVYCTAGISGGSLSIIGHSAGGWLAQVYMEKFTDANINISLLLTLGSPLQPPPKGLPGVIDQTRGLLDYVEKNCRKVVYTPELRYACIAYRYIRGSRFFGNSDPATTILVAIDQSVPDAAVTSESSTLISTGATFRTHFVGQGYKQVCGEADVWGDGVVPEVSAHLNGALNISFNGVYHSLVGSDNEPRPWYGSPSIVEQWVHHLLN